MLKFGPPVHLTTDINARPPVHGMLYTTTRQLLKDNVSSSRRPEKWHILDIAEIRAAVPFLNKDIYQQLLGLLGPMCDL